MGEKVTVARIAVDGMSCGACEQRIERSVRSLDGVRKASASASLAEVTVSYEPGRVDLRAIHDAIKTAGYQVRDEHQAPALAPSSGTRSPGSASMYRFLGLVAVVAALYLIIRYTVGFTFLPSVSQSMGYGLIFVVGLLTSLHCIAMCGGIVLSQGIKKSEGESERGVPALSRGAQVKAGIVPSLLYNGGRVVSYTIIGGAVGALGSLFSLSTALKGAMPIVAGAFMLFLGVRMLGIFPWLSRLKVRLPSLGGHKLAAAASRRGPFLIGLLNGLMPCGPLQTMQVYALGTGSFLAGAFSMFLFSLGTVPLLLGFGALSSLLSAKFNRRMLKASGVLVMVLGLVMFTRGMNLFGISMPSLRGPSTAMSVAKLATDYQEVRTTVESGQYHPLVVQKGVPVRWIVSVKEEDLNGCNSPLTVPQYGITKELKPGDNLIEFTPTQDGTIAYTCWMGMISSSITVVPDLAKLSAADLTAPPAGGIASAFGPGGGGCCGSSTSGRFAGGRIPVDVIQVARRTDQGQVADVTVNDDGYTPAVIVVQRGVKAKIRFVAEKLSSCNSTVNFPEYRGGLNLGRGQLETPYLEVTDDFTFECGMGMLHGYVKVVDDAARVDLQAVARQVAAFKPAASAAGGCCGR
jgi:sulfite exporter TauE/SafE/copper chaperone CopZ